jgi:hypothetical protein
MKYAFIALLFVAAAVHAKPQECKPADPAPQSVMMEFDRAQALYDDARFKSFYTSEIAAQCALPANNALPAQLVCHGGGDFSSCYYSITIVCNASESVGLKALNIKVEFSPPMGSPLNLDLGLSYKE